MSITITSSDVSKEEIINRLILLEKKSAGSLRTIRVQAQQIRALGSLLSNLYSDKWTADPTMTAQERAWSGKHGFQYVLAHLTENWKGTRVPYWKMILDIIPEINTVCEFGCNIGANLKAIKYLKNNINLTGIEINPAACDVLAGENIATVHKASITDASLSNQFDLVFSRGVLIHLNPDELENTLRNMEYHSRRYVLIYEIFSPSQHHLEDYSAIVERSTGEKSGGYQFWRDFSGDFARMYPSWTKVAHGVETRIGANPKHGDICWTIFERPT